MPSLRSSSVRLENSKLPPEALGLDAAGDPAKLEQKLLKAVNNLRLAEDGRKELLGSLIELSEAVLAYQQVRRLPMPTQSRLLKQHSTRRTKPWGSPQVTQPTQQQYPRL